MGGRLNLTFTFTFTFVAAMGLLCLSGLMIAGCMSPAELPMADLSQVTFSSSPWDRAEDAESSPKPVLKTQAGDAVVTYFVNQATGNDTWDGRAAEFQGESVGPKKTIQNAINTAGEGDVVVAAPGVYAENIVFQGRNITLTSANPDDRGAVDGTVIQGDGTSSVVTFKMGENTACVLRGFTIRGGGGTLVNEALCLGAGIYCVQSSPTIVQNVITENNGPMKSGNTIEGYGGGVCGWEASPVIDRNIIRKNQAYGGGGVMVYFGSALVTNNIIDENKGLFGGGCCLFKGGELTNNTLSRNDTVYNGTIYAESSEEYNCLIADNILWKATNGGGIAFYADLEEKYNAIQYNDIWGNTGDPYMGCPDQTGKNGNISLDPQFVNGDTGDYHLTGGSQCLNAGRPDYNPGPDARDFDGEARIYAGRVDIGVDERIGGYQRPTAEAGPNQRIFTIQPVTLDAGGSWFFDPEGARRYQWTQVEGPTVELSDPTACRCAFTPPAETAYRFQLVVWDSNDQSSAPDEVWVIVGNHIPVADTGSNVAFPAGTNAQLDGSRSYDPDPFDTMTYRWTQLEGPAVSLQDAQTARPSFSNIQVGRYKFQLVVNDGYADSLPSTVEVLGAALTFQERSLNLGFETTDYFHYPDVSGDLAVYGVGWNCDYTQDIYVENVVSRELTSFRCREGTVLDTHPKIDGNIVVWCGGPEWGQPWYHEPMNAGILARNLVSGVQTTLRGYTWTESYNHPAVSGNKVIWLEHRNLNLDPRGNPSNWYNTPYSICGADIANLSAPVYFTIAQDVGRRNPYPCFYPEYYTDFNDVVAISGNRVVWEANGDIFGADISDVNHIQVFPICTASGIQFDPSISGSMVVWTDQREDGGDIYAADISDIHTIREFALIRRPGTQKQPSIDRHRIAYVDYSRNERLDNGLIRVCRLMGNYNRLDIPLTQTFEGIGPEVDRDTIVWQKDYFSDTIYGLVLEEENPVEISGYVRTASGMGISGVTVSAGFDGEAVTDSQGFYRVELYNRWSGTIRVMREGRFEPAGRTYENLTASLSDQNFQSLPIYVGPVADPLADGTRLHPYNTIQQAINEAVGGDVVVILPGTYPITNAIDCLGKAITVRSEYNEAGALSVAQTIIESQNGVRGFWFHTNETSQTILAGLTLTRSVSSEIGGGLHILRNSNPTIINCRIVGNCNPHGGGILIAMGNPTFINCLIIGNRGQYGGGGLTSNGSPIFINCTIGGNSARDLGGGVELFTNIGRPEFHNCILWGNEAPQGAEIYDNSDRLTIVNCDIQGLQDRIYQYGTPGLVWGEGNINVDPRFRNTAAGDYRLTAGSSCIDAGNNTFVIPDSPDLDRDGDHSEPLSMDLAGGGRIMCGTVDLGAYEASEPVGLAGAMPEDQKSLWRSQKNIICLTFQDTVAAPETGGLLIQEMLEDGRYGPDLSPNFSVTVENDGSGAARVLKIQERTPSFVHRKWYVVRNTGGWRGIVPFTIQYIVQVGDANNDGQVLNSDVGVINAAIPTFVAARDERRDVNGDGRILNTDVGAVNARIPSFVVPKPSGH